MADIRHASEGKLFKKLILKNLPKNFFSIIDV